MESNIEEEIRKMSTIQLKEKNLIGEGSFAQVYRYQIGDTQLAVKYFKEEEKAQQENVILEQINSLIPDCPGIIKYYAIKKLKIKLNFISSLILKLLKKYKL